MTKEPPTANQDQEANEPRATQPPVNPVKTSLTNPRRLQKEVGHGHGDLTTCGPALALQPMGSHADPTPLTMGPARAPPPHLILRDILDHLPPPRTSLVAPGASRPLDQSQKSL